MDNVVVEMFEARGYDSIVKSEKYIKAVKPNGKKICLFRDVVTKLKAEGLRNFLTQLHEMKIQHGILVYREKPTPNVKKNIESIKNIKVHLELFQENELGINITKHELVPKHRRMDKTETQTEFFTKNRTKFPALLKSDPISRFYAYERGDVIEITRKNGFVCYRIVK